jgi:hypothetical protein
LADHALVPVPCAPASTQGEAVQQHGGKVPAWAVAGLAWAAEVATVVVGHGPMAIQPVVTAFTVCATIWALFLTVPAGRPRLEPGQRVVSEDSYRETQRLVIETVLAMHGDDCVLGKEADRKLRSV